MTDEWVEVRGYRVMSGTTWRLVGEADTFTVFTPAWDAWVEVPAEEVDTLLG